MLKMDILTFWNWLYSASLSKSYLTAKGIILVKCRQTVGQTDKEKLLQIGFASNNMFSFVKFLPIYNCSLLCHPSLHMKQNNHLVTLPFMMRVVHRIMAVQWGVGWLVAVGQKLSCLITNYITSNVIIFWSMYIQLVQEVISVQLQ